MIRVPTIRRAGLMLLLGLMSAGAALAQVKDFQKISATEGNFTGSLGRDSFGSATAGLGDLDGDGINDLAVGSVRDSNGGVDRGAVWILFLNADGTLKSSQKISENEGGFTGDLPQVTTFGRALAGIGDLDGDGIPDLAVTDGWDSDGCPVFAPDCNKGALWILLTPMVP